MEIFLQILCTHPLIQTLTVENLVNRNSVYFSDLVRERHYMV
jgi:hypothetical protein